MAEMINGYYQQVKEIVKNNKFIFRQSALDGKKHVFCCFEKDLPIEKSNGKTIRISGTPTEIIDELKRIVGA